MTGTTINTNVLGGQVAFAGVHTVSIRIHIENLQLTATPPLQAAPESGEGTLPPCPYPGLSCFGPDDSNLFFGRNASIDQLVDKVSSGPITALVGASGSGKSSVVLAGLAPRLYRAGGWRFSHFRIGAEAEYDPFAALVRALVHLLGEHVTQQQLQEVPKLAADLENGALRLSNLISQCRAANTGKRLLLIADQFEEVFTLVREETRRNAFINTLLEGFATHVGRDPPEVCLILTLRADFYAKVTEYREITEALRDRMENLAPMSVLELREAIVNPAGPVRFENGLVETLLEHAQKRLPLLQFALREMWQRLDNQRCLTHEGYEAIGGIEGAIARRAQAIFDARTQQGQDRNEVALFRRLFTRLITLGEGTQETRRIVGRDELGPEAWSLAQDLANEHNRLVVTSAASPGQETVEIVHEALIQHWPMLIEWLNRDRAFQSWLRQLQPRVSEWRAHHTDEGTLLRGGPLAVAEEWLTRRNDEISLDERAYVTASLELRKTEERRKEDALAQEQDRLAVIATSQAKTALLQRRTRLTLAIIMALIIGSAILVYWQRTNNLILQGSLNGKQLELLHERANLFGGLARVEWLTGHPESALRIATAGARIDLGLPSKTVVSSPAEAELAAAVTQSGWHLVLSGHTAGLRSAAFSPDGTRIVTSSADRTARVWDASTGKEVAVLRGHENVLWSAAFSPDGKRVVTAADDRTARVWDAATGRRIATLTGQDAPSRADSSDAHSRAPSFDTKQVAPSAKQPPVRVADVTTGEKIAVTGREYVKRSVIDSIDRERKAFVRSAMFSPDGSRILTASSDGAHIWDAATAREVAVLPDPNVLSSAVFSPDGKRILTVSWDDFARVWDTDTGQLLATLRAPGSNSSPLGHLFMRFTSASFSPDGKTFVTASGDHTARVWETATTREILVLTGHDDLVASAQFSSDGSLIVTASLDRTARVWDARTGKQLLVLRGHTGVLSSAQFSPDNKEIVTTSDDQTARVWALPEMTVLHANGARFKHVAFSPDGSRVVSSSDNIAHVFDLATASVTATLRGHEYAIWSANYSPDGKRIVTVAYDGARIWDAVSGQQLAAIPGKENAMFSAAFSPDGARIITGSDGQVAHIWNADTTQEIAALHGHTAEVRSAVYSADGLRIATASDDKTVRIWNATTAKEMRVLHSDQKLLSVALDADGSRVIAASDDLTARMWDIATGKEIAVLREPNGVVYDAVFGPDDSRILTTAYDLARVWDTNTGQEIMALPGPAYSAAFSPDGKRIVTASGDGTLRIWDVRFATMPAKGLVTEACTRRLRGLSTLTRDEMRLSGYSEKTHPIDVCAGAVK